MSNQFEALIAEMEDAGVDPDFIDRTKAVFEASPLRQELKAAKAEAQQAIEKAQKYESVTREATFKSLGITAKPTAFNLPADIDPTDVEATRTWAVDQGLLAPPEPNVPADQLDALDRVAAAGAGAGATNVDPLAAVSTARNESEFWALAEANGLTSP